jgi:hypothetical protein
MTCARMGAAPKARALALVKNSDRSAILHESVSAAAEQQLSF